MKLIQIIELNKIVIKYKLKCLKCSKVFDSWFNSSVEYEKLKKKNFLTCYLCGSKNIDKTIMSPNILNTVDKINNIKSFEKQIKIKNKILEFQKFIEKNFENVGDNFTYKARSLHYDSKDNQKGIYGNASLKDIKELNEEGIETQVFPWIEHKDN